MGSPINKRFAGSNSGGGAGAVMFTSTKVTATVWLLLTMMIATVSCRTPISITLTEFIGQDPELSQFYDLIERNPIASAALKLRAVTVFAPTNLAFQHYTGNKTVVLYHISTVATPLEQMGSTITSDYDGNPPLYVTRRKRWDSTEDIYINNARIDRERSNVQLTNQHGKKQVLHIIDEVLTPLTVNPSTSFELYNPDAFQFIQHAENLDISQHRIRSFRQKIVMAKKEEIYKAVGGHTFLIPVEEGFKPPPRTDMIDRKVIDGHVIPNHVIFTDPAPLENPFETLAFEDNLKVTATFFRQGEGRNSKVYVRSNTMIGDSRHASGAVLAEIVKANIPVRNGVVHLIHRPLMVVDTTVLQFLEHFKSHDFYPSKAGIREVDEQIDSSSSSESVKEKEDGPLYKFYELIADYAPDFFQTISETTQITLFAPSNEALSHPFVMSFISNLTHNMTRGLDGTDHSTGNREKMRDILNLHMVRDSLTTDKIRKNSQNQVYQIPTGADKKFLYFNVLSNRFDHKQTITVEGGGVNASVVLGDIAAINGYLHIIDRVLGIPYMTVQEKIATDPMLNLTHQFGRLNLFNEQLNKTTKRFTYFIPRNKAWMQWFQEHQHANLNSFLTDIYQPMSEPEYSRRDISENLEVEVIQHRSRQLDKFFVRQSISGAVSTKQQQAVPICKKLSSKICIISFQPTNAAGGKKLYESRAESFSPTFSRRGESNLRPYLARTSQVFDLRPLGSKS
ncbi:LOW QUALITY PROTEIN: fasciclin-1-like [Toxorhynchites rutilus septentrionalis]|uniref:LOW QUALITY PROTEIN: fasciclin-1-like n=1 Tax=Toxorhynchites rutilus septentrionalis TaxID=329112 RepID=UPI002479B368|nr:LOW QUALITY PROTEIN: fasciclin-1-like [Toxorhynchites rutilus septentrionalis]